MSKIQQKTSNKVNRNRLTDKVILVLGASGDIGLAISDLLGQNKAIVCRHGRNNDYSADVRSENQIKQIVENIAGRFGRIDVVINALSAPIKIAPVFKKDWSSFLDHFSVQLKAEIDIVQAVVPHMRLQKKGHFINILSSVVAGGFPTNCADYITAKYAMLGFSRCLYKELHRFGIKVVCISPDFILTKLTAEFPAKLGEVLASENSSKRLTQPNDVAVLVKEIIYNSDGYDGKNIIMSGGRVTASVNLVD